MSIANQKFNNSEDRIIWLETLLNQGNVASCSYSKGRGFEWLYLEYTNPPFGRRIGDVRYIELIKDEEIDLPFIYYREKHIKVEDKTHKNELFFFTKSSEELIKSIREGEVLMGNEKITSIIVLKDGQPFNSY